MTTRVANAVVLVVIVSLCLGFNLGSAQVTYDSSSDAYNYTHPIIYKPASYICYKLTDSIEIDGTIDEAAWQSIPWTDEFVDIEGSLKERPTWSTRAKMAWNDTYFYVAAELTEPHIWATLTERDAIMYHDDDFEIFIDPDGDGHNYFEYEMNAFNAVWDLLMLYPYYVDQRRNYLMQWDVRGLKSAVSIDGTINNPRDIDKAWSVEVAIPWTAFKDIMKDAGLPRVGDQWRINFSRVDWTMEVEDDTYTKVEGNNGKPLPENNWVWSPTGYINMHKPETWGYVQFASDSETTFIPDPEEEIKWALWQVYYQVKQCYKDNTEDYTSHCQLSAFTIPSVELPDYIFSPELTTSTIGFTIQVRTLDGHLWMIDHTARLQKI